MQRPRVRVIAVANQKGGVGKSTTAVSLGAALAEIGKRVLVLDLDPQGNASTGLGIRHEARDVTVYDVLATEAPIENAIVPTPVENLFAVPSTIDLAGAEIELVSQFSRELRLRKALEPLKDSAYDFILLDCPPSLGLLTVNALAAADELIVPIQCEYYALEGLGQLLRNVRLVQQNVNQGLRLTGIVLTMFDPRTKLSEQVVAEVRKYFGDRVYRTVIPRTVRLSEAPGFGQPITVYDPRSRGAERYRDLAAEVIEKLPEEGPLPMLDDVPTVILPPPEPEPVRAPRPLVREEEDREVEGTVEVDSIGEEAEIEADDASPPEPRSDLTSTVRHDGASVEGAMPPVEPSSTSAALEPEAEVEPEPPAATTTGDSPGPEVEPTVTNPEAHVEPSDAASSTGDAGPAPQEPVDANRVVMIEEDAEDTAPESSAPAEGETEDKPKRRWSLFRRGGDR